MARKQYLRKQRTNTVINTTSKHQEKVLKYLYSELGYIPAGVSASLSIKYKPEELKGEKE